MPKKKTAEQFIIEAQEVHGDYYDYSEVLEYGYHGNRKQVPIICPEHGRFWQPAGSHLQGRKCSDCALISRSQKRSLTTQQFIQQANQKHNYKYDYSKVKYENSQTSVTIICPEHGEFEQIPNNHLRGFGCADCHGNKKYDLNTFIIQANELYNHKYDYSKIQYLPKSKEQIPIICPEHGLFYRTVKSHLNNAGCNYCASNKCTVEQFIQQANQKHNYKYDYSEVLEYGYHGNKIELPIICPEHGRFWQTPQEHLRGQHGCSYCSKEQSIIKRTKTTQQFIQQANQKHNYKYDYSKVDYRHDKEPVIIKCSNGHEFQQTPHQHLAGQGCPICNKGFNKQFKLDLITKICPETLKNMDSFQLMKIIQQGKLPQEFDKLIDSEPDSDERQLTLNQLKEKLQDAPEDEEEIIDQPTVPEEPTDSVDTIVTTTNNTNKQESLIRINSTTDDYDALDVDAISSGLDHEVIESLVEHEIKKMWNDVLNSPNQQQRINEIKNREGGEYFQRIKQQFLDEYNQIKDYKPPKGYKGPELNLMQKLTINRIKENQRYGNWSGTGAGKTLSFIVATKEVDSRLTLAIVPNSTVTQIKNEIKSTFPDTRVYTDYKYGQQFNRNYNNYLILNFEKFQQDYSEELLQDLTENHQIDFVTIDEVHNSKQRNTDDLSKRRQALESMMGRVNHHNPNVYVLAMSATPIINELYEGVSLLHLTTGKDYDDLKTRRTLSNALNLYEQITRNGLRYIPIFNMNINELHGGNMSNLMVDGSHLLDDLLNTNNHNQVEKMLVQDKLKALKPYFQKGMVIYTHFTSGFVGQIREYIKKCGYSVETYTGDQSMEEREQNKQKFINGDIDILIGSEPIATGVDGLQKVCNRMGIISLPWTHAFYTQLKGRIYRQGSNFNNADIIVPQVKIDVEDGVWSWDQQRWNLIQNKKTLTDAAVDGMTPSRKIPSLNTLYQKAMESLHNWKQRLKNGEVYEKEREPHIVQLYPEIKSNNERKRRIESDLIEYNRLGRVTHSKTMHERFQKDREEFFRYHQLRRESMGNYEELPYEYIATIINGSLRRDDTIVDFGCGENKFKDYVNNTVYSFDHVAFDDHAIECDIRDVSEHLGDESVDFVIMSLALWGTNYKEYLDEAYRILNKRGQLYIVEPQDSDREITKTLKEKGFKQVGDGTEHRGNFVYYYYMK